MDLSSKLGLSPNGAAEITNASADLADQVIHLFHGLKQLFMFFKVTFAFIGCVGAFSEGFIINGSAAKRKGRA